MDETRADLLQRRVAVYRGALRAGAKGRVAIEYLRQIESDEAELAKMRLAAHSPLTSRGLSADLRPLRSLAHYVSELVNRFDALPVTDRRRTGLAVRIRRIERELARRRVGRR